MIDPTENILKQMRMGANLSQTDFAKKMGMPFRSYQDIELGKNPIRPIHIAAANWALTELASEHHLKSGFLPLGLARIVKEAAKEPEQLPPIKA